MNSGSSKKVVILIGGVPGVGKSSISGYLSRELGFDIVLSGDYLREFLRPFIKSDQQIASSSVYDSWKFFGEKTDENIIKGFLKQAEIMNMGTESTIRRAIDNGEKIILETLYFYPDFLDKYSDSIIPTYLFINNEGDHRKHLEERSEYTHPKSHGSRLSAHLYEYRIIMNKSLEFCERNGIKVFDTTDYLHAREQVLSYAREELSIEQ
jgi:2-phosphoglycerate kinase